MKKIYILGLFILGAISFSWFYFFYEKPNDLVEKIPVAKLPTKVEKRIPPEGMLEYRNTSYRFSLFYPKELEVSEISEGEGVSTITFQNIKDGIGFQIFILPYFEPQVSEARFKKDIPSGVRTNVTGVSVDGAVGAGFYSKDSVLGDTREVWFIKNNFLYEVTTLKISDTWLDNILKTWEFIN